MKLTAKDVIEKRKELWSLDPSIQKDRVYCNKVAEYLVSKDGEELRTEIRQAPYLMIEMFFVIVNKRMETTPFFLNKVQHRLLEELIKAIEEYKLGKRLKLFFILLKGRQQGMTVFISSFQLCYLIVEHNYSGYTLADTGENSESIFEEKGKFVKDRLPECLKPTEKISNKRELMMLKLNSKWRVATAGDSDVGRSKTLNFFHGSECAFWKSIKGIMGGLGNAMVPGSITILESTANGLNEYKQLWDDPENEFKKLFFVWWESDEYTLEFEDKETKVTFQKRVKESAKDTWKDAEDISWVMYKCKWLVNEAKLDWKQVYWYYRKWKEIKSMIRQEYPCTPEEAFMATSQSAYKNIDEIADRIAMLRKRYEEFPPKRGYFSIVWRDPEAHDKIERFAWVNDPNGSIIIYESPVWSHPYVIGGDTKGATMGISKHRDNYAGSVKDNNTGRRVATLWSTTMLPIDYASQMFCLGRYFNNALIAIEINIDQYPQIKLQELGYNNMYIRKVYDTFAGSYKEAYGWRTDSNNRPMIISQHIVLMNECLELFSDMSMLSQCLTFVKDDRRYDHLEGEHDDLLFADMITEEASKTYKKGEKKQEEAQKSKLITQLTKNKLRR